MEKIKVENGLFYNAQTNEEISKDEAIFLLADIEIVKNKNGAISRYQKDGIAYKKSELAEFIKIGEEKLKEIKAKSTKSTATSNQSELKDKIELLELKISELESVIQKNSKYSIERQEEFNTQIDEIKEKLESGEGGNFEAFKTEFKNELGQEVGTFVNGIAEKLVDRIVKIEEYLAKQISSNDVSKEYTELRSDVNTMTKVLAKVTEQTKEAMDTVKNSQLNFEEAVISTVKHHSARIGLTQEEHFDEAIKVVIKEAIQGDMLKNEEIKKGQKAVTANNKSGSSSFVKWLVVGGIVCGALIFIAKFKGIL